MTAINRRRALTGSAAIAVGVPVLAACGSDDEPTATDASSSAPSPSDDSPSGSSTDEPQGGGAALASAADVPVGGCFVVTSAKVVVTQPWCVVESSSDGEIPCPCHGSRFSLADGSPVSGPATSALSPVEITVDGDSITEA